MYNDKLKKQSPVKRAGNILLQEKATPDGHYVVIDAPSLQSFKALREKGVPAHNIMVINKDRKVIQKVKKLGGRGTAGVSTTVLKHYRGAFDGVYLDYCGTPKGNGTYLPQIDICWFVSNLKPNGFMAITFARRGIADSIEVAKSLIPSSMHLVFETTYFETCAMFMMVLSKIPQDTGLTYMCKHIYKDATPSATPSAKPSATPIHTMRKTNGKYQVNDVVGVRYKFENGKIEMLKATVKKVRKTSDRLSYKYWLRFHRKGEGSAVLREENITTKM